MEGQWDYITRACCPQTNLLIKKKQTKITFKHEVGFPRKITLIGGLGMPTVQMFCAVCSPGSETTQCVHCTMLSVVQNYKIHSRQKLVMLCVLACAAGRTVTSYFLCCSIAWCLGKAPFSSKSFSKTHSCGFSHYIQSQNSHRIGLCTQNQGHSPEVPGQGRHCLCWCHDLLSHR